MTVPRTALLGRAAFEPGRTGPARAVAIGLGAFVALVAVGLDWRLLVPLAIAVPLATAAVLPPVTGIDDQPVASAAAFPWRGQWMAGLHRLPFLSFTWAALLALNLLRLLSPNRAATAAASGDLSLDNLLQLAATGLAAAVVATVVLAGWPRRVPRVAALFVVFSLWAAASTLWSPVALLTAARGVQFVVLALFTAYTAGRAASEPGFASELLARTLRLLTVYVSLAALLWLAEVGIDDPRVNWRGNSPNTVGAAMMLPVLALLAHPARARITRPVPWWLVVGGLTALLYFTRSRTFIGAAVGASLALLVAAGRRDARVLGLGVGGVLVAGALASVFARDQVLGVVFRGESSNRVTGFAGRKELWDWVLANPAGSEVWGVGLGASRGRLPFDWNPDNAHNAWVDLLQDLGVVGVGLMAAVVLATVVLVVVRRSVQGAWMLSVVLIATVTGISIAQPGWAAALLALTIVAVADHDLRHPAPASVRPRSAVGAPDQEGDPGHQQPGPEQAEAGEHDGAGRG